MMEFQVVNQKYILWGVTDLFIMLMGYIKVTNIFKVLFI